ncbi:hypothetical protein [Arthrobacter cheniae]|uniref:hypothetical protein n=1 Tax=Arthrobacter cheniae TaxID=1258888 RepID=UPI0011C34D52|nr:hypothetical protein [Arthrobacter cheniae]
MVFSLDSSLVLVAIVGLWLVWVAPSVLRRTTPDLAGASHQSPIAGTRRSMESMMTMTAPQDDHARSGNTHEPHPATTDKAVAHATGASWRPDSSGVSMLHRGRIGVALLGLLALLALPVTLILSAFGVVSLLVPLVSVGVAVAAVLTLRAMAIRSRRARVERAFAEAMAPVRIDAPVEDHPPVHDVPTAPRRPTTLFDAEETPVRPLTPMELRTAALAVAHGSSIVDVRSSVPPAPSESAGQSAGTTAWAPVEVPRPTYVDAAKAERQAPAPLDLPEAPRPLSKTPIKASEAAARVAAATEEAEALDGSAAPATGRINLDDVLQRRRA